MGRAEATGRRAELTKRLKSWVSSNKWQDSNVVNTHLFSYFGYIQMLLEYVSLDLFNELKDVQKSSQSFLRLGLSRHQEWGLLDFSFVSLKIRQSTI